MRSARPKNKSNRARSERNLPVVALSVTKPRPVSSITVFTFEFYGHQMSYTYLNDPQFRRSKNITYALHFSGL